MQYKKLQLIATILLGFGLTGLQAQETIPATGGDASGSGGSVSYTVGQFVYSTYTGTNGYEAQGVQQPYEISEVIGIEPAKDITLLCSVYPNPTRSVLWLKVENYVIKDLSYRLFSINGKLLINEKITSNMTSIKMAKLPSATYFIKIFDTDTEIKTFKIIKS
ncbi:MAG: T9SS type A sorting domain-containing protein [Bacteroidales bacterium]|nr:T9SS type A sorting domain-containing protein [Bacteroidales bacterium]